MPSQALEFDLPFAARFNPLLDTALPRHLAWLEEFRLLPGEGALDEYLDWRFPDLAARWFPAADESDFGLALDAYAWMVVLDGQWDTALGRDPNAVKQAVYDLTAVVRGDSPSRPNAAARALGDIWRRQCAGMPGFWQARAAADWVAFFESVVVEAEHRSAGITPTEEEYRKNRDTTGYMRVLLGLTQRLRRFAIPDRVYEDAAFRALTEPYVWAHNMLQDLFSVEREAIQGDVHNIVFCLEHHRRLPRPEAFRTAVSMFRVQVAEFVRAEADLPAALDRLEVPLADRTRIYDIVDDLRATFNASYTWCRTSTRYQSSAETPEGQPGYLGDILSSE